MLEKSFPMNMTTIGCQHMTRTFLLTLSAIWITLGATINAQESNEHILLDQLRVIVGDGSVLTNAAVLLRGDTIVAVGASADMDIPADTTRIDLAGKTLLPTLIDAHAHLGYEGTSSWGAQNYTRDNILDQLQRYAYYGFGAVFSAGSDPDMLALEIQRQQAAGEIGGARFVFAAGMAPPGQGPNNQFLIEALTVEQQTGNTILRGLGNEEEARAAVRAVAELEIPFIKLWVDDRNGSQVKLSPAIYRATIAAKQNDVFIIPNLGLAELRREAIGDDPFLSHTLPADTALRISASAQRLQVPQRDPQLEDTLRNSFAMLLNANVDIVLGTDAGDQRGHQRCRESAGAAEERADQGWLSCRSVDSRSESAGGYSPHSQHPSGLAGWRVAGSHCTGGRNSIAEIIPSVARDVRQVQWPLSQACVFAVLRLAVPSALCQAG